MKLTERNKMKKLIAIVLGIALLSPAPAIANGSTYQFLTPVLTTTYELPAETYNSRWGKIEIPFSVVLISDGTVASFHFNLIDAEGFKIAYKQNISPNNLKIGHHKDPVTWTQNNKWELYKHNKAKLPIRLQTEIEFWRSTGKASIIQTFPMNFTIHKDDLAEKLQAEAEAKARAEAVAKAQAEAKAKAEAEAKAKAEAEAKVKAEAEAKAKAEAEAKAKAEAEALAKAKAEAEAKAKAEAEAKAKAEAELKAKQEAEAKAKAEAEAKAKAEAELKYKETQTIWNCAEGELHNYYFNTYNKLIPDMNKAEASTFCNNLAQEYRVKKMEIAKAETEKMIAEIRAEAEALLKPFVGKSCKVLGNYKVVSGSSIKCIKVKNKKVWGKLKLN